MFCFVFPLIPSKVGPWFRYERRLSRPDHVPDLPSYPRVSLVVPCHNEEDNVRETIANLLAQNYPDFEGIAVNDGSRDKTGAILDSLLEEHGGRLRVIHQMQNQGKAMGLNGGALLDHNAIRWMMVHFLRSPRIRNRSSILGKLQVGEFSSSIGLIKRAQRTCGRLFTVSGVVAGFRKAALHDVGSWSADMLPEDIDISWILMPETLWGLWKLRLRWSMGGTQADLKYAGMGKIGRKRRMWPIDLECIASFFISLMAAVLLGWAGFNWLRFA